MKKKQESEFWSQLRLSLVNVPSSNPELVQWWAVIEDFFANTVQNVPNEEKSLLRSYLQQHIHHVPALQVDEDVIATFRSEESKTFLFESGAFGESVNFGVNTVSNLEQVKFILECVVSSGRFNILPDSYLQIVDCEPGRVMELLKSVEEHLGELKNLRLIDDFLPMNLSSFLRDESYEEVEFLSHSVLRDSDDVYNYFSDYSGLDFCHVRQPKLRALSLLFMILSPARFVNLGSASLPALKVLSASCLTKSGMEEFLCGPLVKQLDTLQLWIYRDAIDGEYLQAHGLTRGRPDSSPSFLHQQNFEADEDILAIANSESVRGLKNLFLMAHRLELETIRTLFHSPNLRDLEILGLYLPQEQHQQAIELLKQSPMKSSLKDITFEASSFDDVLDMTEDSIFDTIHVGLGWEKQPD